MTILQTSRSQQCWTISSGWPLPVSKAISIAGRRCCTASRAVACTCTSWCRRSSSRAASISISPRPDGRVISTRLPSCTTGRMAGPGPMIRLGRVPSSQGLRLLRMLRRCGLVWTVLRQLDRSRQSPTGLPSGSREATLLTGLASGPIWPILAKSPGRAKITSASSHLVSSEPSD